MELDGGLIHDCFSVAVKASRLSVSACGEHVLS